MKRIITILSLISLVSESLFAKTPGKSVSTKTVKSPSVKDTLYLKIEKDDAIFFTGGNMYIIQAESISSAGNMLYFAAKDFTADKDLIVKKIGKIELKVDKPERKVVKITMYLGDKEIDPNYSLEIYSEIRKGMPFLALYSRFIYLGEGIHKCGINWGLSSPYVRDPYKYYTFPKEGKVITYRLASKSEENKIGYAKWLYVHNGKGVGAGLICPSMLGKGDDFIFINSVPPEKDLEKNDSCDIFMIFMPISKNFKILEKIYNTVAKIEWTFD